ncbi:MAG: transcriptional repressor LexA [Thermomicrobiales bacterium]
MKPLTRRQQAILTFIEEFSDTHSYPPTIREIQEGLNISSTSVVDYNLKVLEQRDEIRRNRNISRGIELTSRPAGRSNLIQIPIVGQIAAGQPISVPGDLGPQVFDESLEISPEMLGSNQDGLFALRVKGHSMVDALINDGDVVILKEQHVCENGETVAVWLVDEEETTLKRFYLEGEQVRLQPENVTMEPIYTRAENVEIQGKLVTVIRPPR